jgi:hypothetical protein
MQKQRAVSFLLLVLVSVSGAFAARPHRATRAMPSPVLRDGSPLRTPPPIPADRFGRPVRKPNGSRIKYSTEPAIGARAVSLAGPPAGRLAVGSSEVPLEWFRAIFGTGIGYTGLIVADVDGDHKNEIIAGATAGGFGLNSYWYILEDGPDGYSKVWTSPQYASSISSVRAADVTGDGVPEILIGLDDQILVYDGATHALLRTIPTASHEVRGLNVADVDATASSSSSSATTTGSMSTTWPPARPSSSVRVPAPTTSRSETWTMIPISRSSSPAIPAGC